MILIDTSVWIEFFKQNKIYTEPISVLLKNKMIIAHEPVFSELLYGVRAKKDKEKIMDYWDALPKITLIENSMLKAAEYANHNNFHNLGIGLMDTLIILASIEGNHSVWSLDKKINKNIDAKYIFRPE